MKLCVIAPQHYLSWTCAGDWHFTIAPYIFKYPFYRQFYENHDKPYCLIDSGMWELGRPIGNGLFVRAADVAKANEIIMPDKEFHPKQTLQYTMAFLKETPERDLKRFKLQLVLQGKDYDGIIEWFRAFELMDDIWPIECYGVPLYNKDWVGRIGVVQKLLQMTDKPLHLLGMHDPLEFASYRSQQVRSADGSFPVKVSMHRYKHTLDRPLPMFYRKSEETPYDPDLLEYFEHNISILQSAMSRNEH